MSKTKPGRGLIKRNVRDDDKVYVAPNCSYVPETDDHRRLWPKVCGIIGEHGAWYSTLRAACGANKDYIAYLIGDLGALVCPDVDRRMGRGGS
jgi:hypothetical protein